MLLLPFATLLWTLFCVVLFSTLVTAMSLRNRLAGRVCQPQPEVSIRADDQSTDVSGTIDDVNDVINNVDAIQPVVGVSEALDDALQPGVLGTLDDVDQPGLARSLLHREHADAPIHPPHPPPDTPDQLSLDAREAAGPSTSIGHCTSEPQSPDTPDMDPDPTALEDLQYDSSEFNLFEPSTIMQQTEHDVSAAVDLENYGIHGTMASNTPASHPLEDLPSTEAEGQQLQQPTQSIWRRAAGTLATVVRHFVRPDQRVVLLLGESGSGKNFTAKKLAQAGEQILISQGYERERVLGSLSGHIPHASPARGQRGTCCVEGPFQIDINLEDEKPMQLINTPGINDPNGEDFDLAAEWKKHETNLKKTSHVIFQFHQPRDMLNKYLVPYNAFIKPKPESAAGVRVSAICIRDSFQEPDKYEERIDLALQHAAKLGLNVSKIQRKLLDKRHRNEHMNGGENRHADIGIFATHNDEHFKSLWQYLKQTPVSPTFKIDGIKATAEVELPGAFVELRNYLERHEKLEGDIRRFSMAVQSAKRNLAAARLACNEQQNACDAVSGQPRVHEMQHLISGSSSEPPPQRQTYSTPFEGYICRSMDAVTLENITAEEAVRRRNNGEGLQDDADHKGQPSKEMLDQDRTIGRKTHTQRYVEVSGDRKEVIIKITAPPRKREMVLASFFTRRKHRAGWWFAHQYITIRVTIKWDSCLEEKLGLLRLAKDKCDSVEQACNDTSASLQQLQLHQATIIGELGVYQKKHPAVYQMVVRHIERMQQQHKHGHGCSSNNISSR